MKGSEAIDTSAAIGSPLARGAIPPGTSGSGATPHCLSLCHTDARGAKRPAPPTSADVPPTRRVPMWRGLTFR